MGGSPQFAQEPQFLRVADGLLDERADPRVGAVHRPLPGEGVPRRYADRDVGAAVALVGPIGDVDLVENVDDAMVAGCSDVVEGSGQGRQGP
jgi:hypothetical protein